MSYQYHSVYLLYWCFSLIIIVRIDHWELCERSETCAKSLLCEMTGYGFFIYWGTEGGEWEWWVGEEQRFFKAFCIDHKVCFLFWFTIINYILNIRKIPSAFCFDSKYLKAKCFWLQIKLKHFYSKRSPRRSSSKSPFVNASQQSNIRKVLTEEWVHCQLKLIINPFHCTCISLYK